MKVHEKDDILQLPPARPLRPDEVRNARITVIENCPEDAKDMLEMLGIA